MSRLPDELRYEARWNAAAYWLGTACVVAGLGLAFGWEIGLAAFGGCLIGFVAAR